MMIFHLNLPGRELTRRLHDGGPEEVHRGHEEGLLEEAGQGAAEAVLETPSHHIFYHYQQKVRHDYHGFHWSQHGGLLTRVKRIARQRINIIKYHFRPTIIESNVNDLLNVSKC